MLTDSDCRLMTEIAFTHERPEGMPYSQAALDQRVGRVLQLDTADGEATAMFLGGSVMQEGRRATLTFDVLGEAVELLPEQPALHAWNVVLEDRWLVGNS